MTVLPVVVTLTDTVDPLGPVSPIGNLTYVFCDLVLALLIAKYFSVFTYPCSLPQAVIFLAIKPLPISGGRAKPHIR